MQIKDDNISQLPLWKFRPSCLKRISFILSSPNTAAGIGIQRYGNLESQRSAHWPCPNKPLNCPTPSAQQSRTETPHDTLILSETASLLHTARHRVKNQVSHFHHFPDFATLAFDFPLLYLESVCNSPWHAMHYQSLLCTSTYQRRNQSEIRNICCYRCKIFRQGNTLY